jgi:hypothetical protein
LWSNQTGVALPLQEGGHAKRPFRGKPGSDTPPETIKRKSRKLLLIDTDEN